MKTRTSKDIWRTEKQNHKLTSTYSSKKGRKIQSGNKHKNNITG